MPLVMAGRFFLSLILLASSSVVLSSRVTLARGAAQNWTMQQFGVLHVAFDKVPSNATAEGEPTTATVEALILERLNALRLNPSLKEDRDYQCYVTMDELLDAEMQVVRGGLAVVVQKLATENPPYRINFYKTEPFRAWLSRRPMDIPVNELFVNEEDVWVSRLVVASSDDVKLPSLEPIQGSVLTSLFTAHAQTTALAIPRNGEEFTFYLQRLSYMFSSFEVWESIFARYTAMGWHRQLVVVPAECVLKVEGRPRNFEYAVKNESDDLVLKVKDISRRTARAVNTFIITPATSDDVLFTISLSERSHGEAYFGTIRQGADPGAVVYNVWPQGADTNRYLFYHPDMRTAAYLRRNRVSSTWQLKVLANEDVALLLLAATELARKLQ
eukprot:TRINITY_DN22603_c0_g1_i2.p1 TRINITY_DN22603_c0_g1~~TRINITY_DN22603_c0_g1_i2.p1  ORF type:complete len:386 (-),score=42.27 TRINITY_DN22603_c0_g1_i2:175-1332(-)